MSQNAATEPLKGEGAPLGAMALLRARCLDWLDPTKRRALTALTIRVVGAALAYLMQILLAQWMGLTEYGVFVGIWVWLLVLGGIAPMGLNVSSIGLLSTYLDTRDFERWRGLMLTSYCDRVGRFFDRGAGWTALYC